MAKTITHRHPAVTDQTFTTEQCLLLHLRIKPIGRRSQKLFRRFCFHGWSEEAAADDVRVRRAEAQAPVVRRYTEARYGAKSWRCERRVAARIEATTKGLDIRFVVTNIARGNAEWLYDTLYCARGQAENLIKLHKSQLASDRTSCRSPLANRMRLVLHTGANWLMYGLREALVHGLVD